MVLLAACEPSAAAVPSPTVQPSFKASQFACTTQQSAEEMRRYLVNKDERGAKVLYDRMDCIIPKAGVQVSVAEVQGSVVRVRAYPEEGGEPVQLWTYPGALNGYR